MNLSSNDYTNSSPKVNPLIQRMRDDMVLRDLSKNTGENYITGILRLERHYSCSAEKISEEEVRGFILFLKERSGLSPDTIRVYFYGIKFFYQITMKQNWKVFDDIRVPQPKHLPIVLSFEEILRILPHVHHPMYRMMLTLIYACGLRISECTNLRVEDVDGSRMVVRVKGKGNRYREVPIPKHVLDLLRIYWRVKRSRPLLFPSGKVDGPVAPRTVRYAFEDACEKAKINKKTTVHTLRHSYATHLLENGVSLPIIQGALGHKTTRSTIRYTHLTSKTDQVLNKAVNEQMSKL